MYQPVDETGESHRQLAAAGCHVTVADPQAALAERLAISAPVHALLGSTSRPERLSADLMQALPELRIVAKYSIGVDDVDVDAATELGVLVTHCPTEANWGGVAEGAIGFMLALLKKLPQRDAHVRNGGWRADRLRGRYLGSRADGYPGLTVGLIGFGRIGRRVAELLAPWKLSLVACDPYVDADVFTAYGVTRLALDELLGRSDVLSLHCSLTDETRGMISAEKLGLIKQDALLINTARGELVDVGAVCDALDAGALAGAAFDVLPVEPPPPGSAILKANDRVLLSPHMIAANTGGTLTAAIPWATDAVLAALAGEVPQNVYNMAAIERWSDRFAGKSLFSV